MPLPAGTRLGSYEVHGLIGSGGMGEVYRAHDARLGRDVAIKVLPASFRPSQTSVGGASSRDDRHERFEREARAVASLSHPNIIAVHDYGVHDGQPFVVMELLAGQTLRDRLIDGPLPVRKAVAIATDIARGLAAAHEKHIVHRDLKPDNVFLLADGQVKILDFGLARDVLTPTGSGATETVARTDPGTVLGTVGYMAPEQVRGGQIDVRTDLFAFGGVLYEMLAGVRAFQRATAAETMTAILREDPPELAGTRPDVPPALERILHHALEKNPDERFQTARDVIFALTSLSGASLPASGSNLQPADRTAPADMWRTSTPVLVAAGIAVAAASVAGWCLGRETNVPTVARWDSFTQLTDAAGEEAFPRVSPDGASFAYAGLSASASWDLYTQRAGGRRPVLVAGDPARHEVWPAFSPDGRFIAFNEGDADGGIFITGATGESERRLTDFGGNPAWSPDGTTIVFATETIWYPYSRLTERSGLWTVSASGGTPRQIYGGDAVQPSWSPTGRRIAFWSVFGGQRDLVTAAADGSDVTRLTDDGAVDWCPMWSPDGRYLYFASDRGGSMNLWRIPVDGETGRSSGAPEPVTTGAEAAMDQPSFSADGRTLLLSAGFRSVNPAAIPFDPVALRAAEPRVILHRTGLLYPDSVSPDGAWLALFNPGERQPDLFVMRPDGADLRRLTDDDARDVEPQWSPDGTFLTFQSNRGGRYATWSIRPDGSGLSVFVERRNADVTDTAISPADGRAVFSANLGSYLARPPFPAPEDRHEQIPNLTVSVGRLVPLHWSPDGRYLSAYVVTTSGTPVGVAVYDVIAQQPRMLTEDPWIFSPVFLPDSRRLAYFTFGSELVVVDIASGSRRVIPTTLPFRVAPGALAMAPDGRTLYVGAERTEANVWKVEVDATR